MTSIDRTSTTPTLVRCFWKKGSHNSVTEYRQIAAGVCPSNEVAIYVWKDSTLREIFELVEGSIPCGPSATLDFRMIFIDKSNHLQMKNVSICCLVTAQIQSDHSLVTLDGRNDQKRQ